MMASKNYSSCVLYDKDKCGPHKRSRLDGVFQCGELQDIVTEDITEKQLIEYRIFRTLDNKESICAFHRQKFGNYWEAPTRCMHPLHHYACIGPKMKKVKDVRQATSEQYRIIDKHYPKSFPIFAKLCSYHRKNLIEVSTDTFHSVSGNEDEDYQCMIPLAENSYNKDDVNEFLDNSVNISPVKFQINQTSVNDLSKTAMNYHKRKFHEAVESFKLEYSKRIAPGQETQFVEQCETEASKIPELPLSEITLLRDAYLSADTENQRILILSALPPERYSKKEVMKMFQCNRYMVDQARKWRREDGALIAKEKKLFSRVKMDLDGARHFIEFLFSSDLLQDIAYGTNTLIYSNGQKQLLPKSILTMSRSHTIVSYKSYCESMELPIKISESSMWKILNQIKPSQRHALAGLDDISNTGLTAFSLLENILVKLDITQECKKDLEKRLENGKKYLKFGFTQHCQDDAVVSTHCIKFSLFNEKEKDFQPEYEDISNDDVCEDCYLLLNSG